MTNCTGSAAKRSDKLGMLQEIEIKLYAQPTARLSMKNGKFTVSDIYTGVNSSASPLQIGEMVLSVNGKIPSDFKDDCDFLLWMYQYKNSELTIKKMDGSEILVKRSNLLL